jgi:hypothetical protein
MGKLGALPAMALVAVCAKPGTNYAGAPPAVVTAGSATVNVGDIFSIPIAITGALDLTAWNSTSCSGSPAAGWA